MSITEVTRRNVLDLILSSRRPFHGRMDIIRFLNEVWDLTNMPSTDSRFENAVGDVWQHMVNNSDWTDEELLVDRLKLIYVADTDFLRFLEVFLHPVSIREREEAQNWAGLFNQHLAADGYGMQQVGSMSGYPIYCGVKLASGQVVSSLREKYEVVLSFAGEERPYVEQVARYLESRGVSFLYDRYEEETLWGKDLAEYLQGIYTSARYCIMFVSSNYASKTWTNHERRSALERAIREKGEYILPARFDDTLVPGLSTNIGYVDLRVKTPEALGELIIKKLGRSQTRELAQPNVE